MTSVINPAAEPPPGGPAGTAATTAPDWADAGTPPDQMAPDQMTPEQMALYHVPPYEERPPWRVTALLTRLYARSPRWLAPVAVLACVAGASGYILATDPTDVPADAVPTCFVRLTTGFDCPGCGGTRAFFYVLHGNLPAAARHHLIFVFLLPFLVYMYVAWTGRRVFRWRLPALRLPPMTVSVFLVVWFVFTVARNLPWAPFSWLFV